MFKVMRLMSMLSVLLVAIACSKGSGGDQPSPPVGGSGAVAGPISPMTPPPPAGVAGETISGTITVAPSLAGRLASGDVIYIIARDADRPGPPLAVQQVLNAQFPLHYTLSSADLMMQGANFQGKVNIVVRLDRDGAAGPPQPGDMEGVFAGNPATVGDQKVDIIINKMF